MSAWVLVPCLVTLREEFNAVSPKRDKGADGSIGDSSHTSASDHAADEDSDVLRARDADSKNEVHALDIDSSGPWPAAGWFDRTIKAIVAREKAEYLSAVMVGRLKYVIWNRQIAERSNGWAWRPYNLADPHTNHAHFSARYESGPEADTRPWGVAEEDDMPTADEIAEASATKVWGHLISSPSLGIKARAAADWLKDAEQVSRELAAMGKSLTAALTALTAKDVVDEQALGAALAPGLAIALGPLLQDVEVTPEQLQAAILGALRELAASPAA